MLRMSYIDQNHTYTETEENTWGKQSAAKICRETSAHVLLLLPLLVVLTVTLGCLLLPTVTFGCLLLWLLLLLRLRPCLPL